jgi:hypothetical protein
MSLPILAYNNIMTTGTVTATSSDTSFPVSNLTNWKSARWWKAAATGTHYINVDAGALVDVDYFGVFSHNLTEQSATVKLQWSNDGATGWTDLTSALAKSESEVIFDTFTSVNKRYFRVEVVAATAIPAIGIIGIGEYVTMQRGISAGFVPPHLNTKNKYLINESEAGSDLGNSLIRRAAMLSATMDVLTTAWVRSTWEPIIEHSETNPMFFSWNHSGYPNEAVLVKIDPDKSAPKYKDTMYMSVKMTGKAWHKYAQAVS